MACRTWPGVLGPPTCFAPYRFPARLGKESDSLNRACFWSQLAKGETEPRKVGTLTSTTRVSLLHQHGPPKNRKQVLADTAFSQTSKNWQQTISGIEEPVHRYRSAGWGASKLDASRHRAAGARFKNMQVPMPPVGRVVPPLSIT